MVGVGTALGSREGLEGGLPCVGSWSVWSGSGESCRLDYCLPGVRRLVVELCAIADILF